MARDLTDKNVVIIGGSKGIGLGIVNAFSGAGANVLMGSRSPAIANDQIKTSVVDIADEESVKAFASHADEVFAGKVDVVVQNAGIYPACMLEDMSLDAWNKVINVNLTGTFLAVKYLLPLVKQSSHGRIIIISSITGPKVGSPGLCHYSASKAGIDGFVKTAAIELAKYKITVNMIEPGNILTDALAELGRPSYISEQEKAIPMGCLGTVDDIANTSLFLASEGAKYITGQSIVVDGGQILPESHYSLASV